MRHMHDYGTTHEQIAQVAATIRNNGYRNPEAMHFGRGPFSVEDILASRWIAEPLHLLECSLVGQCGVAIVLTSGERARDLRQRPVYVLAGAMEMDDGPHHNPALNRVNGDLGSKRMKVAYSQVGITPGDIDVLSVYDPTAFEVIRNLEMLGFCGPGEGGPFVESGAIAPSGKIPTNTDGGLLSHAQLTTGPTLAQSGRRCPSAARRLRRAAGRRGRVGGMHEFRARCASRRGTDSGERAMTTTKYSGRPVPQPTELSQPYWDAALRGELLYLRCRHCGTVFFPPLAACIACQSEDVGWQRSAGRGIVYSYTVLHGAPSAGFPCRASWRSSTSTRGTRCSAALSAARQVTSGSACASRCASRN